MHRGVRLKKVTTKRTKVSPSVAASTLAQAFKVNFQILLHTDYVFTLITLVLINFSLPYQHTGTSAKTRSTTADAPKPSPLKRKGSKSTRSQAKRQRTATPSPPPVSLETQTQQVPSPPQSQEEPQVEELQPEVPQSEEIPTDVHEQTTDSASLIIASVVSSIQTSTAPPQGNILSIYCQ